MYEGELHHAITKPWLSTEEHKCQIACDKKRCTERGKHEYAFTKGASRALLVVSVPLLAEC